MCRAQGGRKVSGSGTHWYRGQVHMHSYWSDGQAFPEQAVSMYRSAGFNFLAFTEHNVVATNQNVWREIAEATVNGSKIAQERYNDYVNEFSAAVESRVEEGKTYVRLKTWEEVKALFHESGEFIMMPGMEITQKTGTNQVHMNYINIPKQLAYSVPSGVSVSQLIAHNAIVAAAAGVPTHEYTLALNHPCWVFCDILPQDLIERPEIRFFEVCNGGSSYAPPAGAERYGTEMMWDSVNAFRRLQNKQLMFALGTDDAHHYTPPKMDFADGFGSAWIEVRSAELTPQAIMAAMHAGNYYATCGVLLNEVDFDPTERRLHVKVRPQAGVSYTIKFITTKRNFNQQITYVESPASGNKPARSIPIYSEDVGRVVSSMAGVEASYQMDADDLYVRARVESSEPGKYARNFYPLVKTAWTQPFASGVPSAVKLKPVVEATSDSSVPLHTKRVDVTANEGTTPLSLTGYLAVAGGVAPLDTTIKLGTRLHLH